MKPVRFDYERPSDLATALTLGTREDVVVKFLAGGQSLGPMLNLRLVQPDLLVDITAIAELKQVEETADGRIQLTHPHGCTRETDFGQSGADNMLPGEKSRPTRGA